MTVARFAVSFDKKLAREVRRAAGKQSLSAWLADAAASKLQSQGLLEAVRDWEAEHGEITDEELEAAKRRRSRWAK